MKNSEQQAFPSQQDEEGFLLTKGGLTKREYFAGLALQGLLSNPAHNDTILMGVNGGGVEKGFIALDLVVKEAIGYADELLKQLVDSE